MKLRAYGVFGAALATALMFSGCLEISNIVRVNEDGSARVTETVRFSPKLLALEKQLDIGYKIADCVTRQAAEKRAEDMGEGTKVASHKAEDMPDGGKKITVVYENPNINRLRVCMIPLGPQWQKYSFRYSFGTMPTDRRNQMSLNVLFENWDKAGTHHIGSSLKPMPELDLQTVRKLVPMFKDMIEGFRLTSRIEIFDLKKWRTITHGYKGGGIPHYRTSGGRVTVLDISARDLLTNDDAIMAVVPWRQEGNEHALRGMIDFSMYVPGYHQNIPMEWPIVQHPTYREYN